MIFDKYKKTEKYGLLLCLAAWAHSTVLSFLYIALSKVIGDNGTDFFFYIFYGFLIFRALPYIKERVSKSTILIVFLMASVYGLSHLFHPENEYLGEHSYAFFTSILPFLFVGSMFDLEKIEPVMLKTSYFSIILTYFYIFIVARYLTTTMDDMDSYMQASYNVLPHILYAVFVAFRERRITYWIVAIFGTILIFSMGSRGPVVCLILFFAFMTMQALKKSKLQTRLFILGVLVIMLFNVDSILVELRGIIGTIGGSDRIFELLNGREYGQDDSSQERILYYGQVITAINNNIYWGLGTAGDRLILGSAYVHNLFLELLVSYGYVGGIVAIIALITMLVKGYKHTQDINSRSFLYILFCCGFANLFLSNSYLSCPCFFLLIGYCIQVNSNKLEGSK